MKKIKWIHFSDLHLNETGVETNRLRKKLIEYLRSLNLHCDYAFFTGDVRYAPSGAFPADAAAYLKSVCEAVNVPIERLFVVPGNHDIKRSLPGRDDAVKRIHYQNQGYYDPMQGSINDDDLRSLFDGQQEFREFLKTLYADVPGRVEAYQNFQSPHFCMNTDDLNIVHVDSTITYTTGQERDLIVGTGSLMAALEHCDNNKPTVLLTHYSYDYLHRNEQNQIFQLMQDYHIQLWIAGHEHDHLCRMQRGYFHELQCGNLVLENGAKSCVLIGSLDLDTSDGEIRSHAWFPQGGWAQYPFIRTGTEDNSVYPFVLTLPGADSSFEVSREERNILEVCQSLENEGGPFCGVHFRGELMPDLQWNTVFFQNKEGNIPLVEAMCALWTRKQKEPSTSWHALLLGDGGMGKSTMLFHTCKHLIRQHRLTVYASLNMLQSEHLTIQSCILRMLYRSEDEAAKNKLIRLITENGVRPNLIVLIDGFNELNSDSSYRYATELKQLALSPGIQIVVSSRLDFLRYYGMAHFQMLKTSELRDEQISTLFQREIWQDILSKRHLHILLKNPMMALLYAQTSPIIERYKDLSFCDWKLPVCNATDLMHNYYMAQVALTLERSDEVGKSVYINYIVVKYILPYLAYQGESVNQMAWSYADYNKVFNEAVQDGNERVFAKEALPENLQMIKRCYRVSVVGELPKDVIDNAIISELCLLRDNGNGYSFSHQIYRDYLAAVYLYNVLRDSAGVSELWQRVRINEGVAQYLRHMHKNIWGEDGLLAQRLRPYRGIAVEDGDFYIENLLNCWLSENPDAHEVRDLSGLDLRKISLAKHLKQSYQGTILLDGAKVSRRTFVNERRHNRIVDLAFSHDGRTLAAVSANGIVSVSNILTQSQMIVGEIELATDTSIYYTAEDYLLLKTGGKAYKWSTVAYDKIVEADAGDTPLVLPKVKNGQDPADALYKTLRDSDMLGSKTVVSEDGLFIAVGYHSGHIQIWDTREQTVAAELTLGDGQVATASFSPNGEIAAVGAGGALVQLWSIKEGKCRGILHFEKPVHRVRFPASTDFSKDPYLECEYSDGHCFRVHILTGAFSAYKNKQETLRVQRVIRSHLKKESIKKIDVASNGNAVVLLNNSNRLFVWNDTTHMLNPCVGHTSKILDAAICTADPRYAASYSDERIRVKGKDTNHLDGNKVIRAWAIRKGNCMQRLSTNQRTIQRIQFFTTNRIILAGFATNGDIMLWELINKMVNGKEHGHWNLIDTVRNNSAEPMECAVDTREKIFIGVNADGTMFSRSFSGVEKKCFKVFPGIDLTPLRWDTLDCSEELKTILLSYI